MIFSPDGRTRVLFIEVLEPKTIKNRIHFDLRPTDGTREQEVERLVDPRRDGGRRPPPPRRIRLVHAGRP